LVSEAGDGQIYILIDEQKPINYRRIGKESPRRKKIATQKSKPECFDLRAFAKTHGGDTIDNRLIIKVPS
jgi:hypothetical protein